MEINKIILIGNGFDLAHSLKTSYADFMRFTLLKELKAIKEHIQKSSNYNSTLDSKLYNLNIGSFLTFNYNNQLFTTQDLNSLDNKNLYKLARDIEHSIKKDSDGISFTIKNNFLNNILNDGIENWVDLEDTYFKALLNTKNEDIIKLNNDFENIKNLFEDYLHEQVIPSLDKTPTSQTIHNIINSNIVDYELSNVFLSEINRKKADIEAQIELKEWESNNNHLFARIYSGTKKNNQYAKKASDNDKEIEKLREELQILANNSPKKVFFVNFNYTNTIDKYSIPVSNIIYIHGKLKDKSNPIILGYGDERGEEYKNLELKSNEYLKNIKSFAYSNTTNYKDLIRIVESNPYQVIILGHSCGMSDRVLLSTLFEHENCKSIKPYYYYNKTKGTDNYQDIIMNISRNFIDKSKMRDLVVDKTNTGPIQ